MTSPKSYDGNRFRRGGPVHRDRVARGEDNIGSFNETPQSYRKWCKTCGGHVFTEHPRLGLTGVYAAIIPDVPFIPGCT